jgi:hypothetical protein
VIRPQMPREKRHATASRVSKILRRFHGTGLVALDPEPPPATDSTDIDGGAAAAEDGSVAAATALQLAEASSVLVTILKSPVLQGFGSGELDSPTGGAHAQTVSILLTTKC